MNFIEFYKVLSTGIHMKIKLLKGLGVKIIRKNGDEFYFGTYKALHKEAYEVSIEYGEIKKVEKIFINITDNFSGYDKPQKLKDNDSYLLTLSLQQMYDFEKYFSKKERDKKLQEEFEELILNNESKEIKDLVKEIKQVRFNLSMSCGGSLACYSQGFKQSRYLDKLIAKLKTYNKEMKDKEAVYSIL